MKVFPTLRSLLSFLAPSTVSRDEKIRAVDVRVCVCCRTRINRCLASRAVFAQAALSEGGRHHTALAAAVVTHFSSVTGTEVVCNKDD